MSSIGTPAPPTEFFVTLESARRRGLLIAGRLIVEADGYENHDAEPHRHRDLVRDATAAVWGYRSIRFDYAMTVHDWDLVEAAILAALATA